MSEPLQGEIVSPNQRQSPQQPTPSASTTPWLWAGCLSPILLIGLIAYLIWQGINSSAGLELIRGFIIFIVGYLLLQLFFGGGLLKRRQTIKATLLANASLLLLLAMLAIVGLITVVQNLLS